MKKPLIRIFAMLTAVALSLAACGGQDTATDTEKTPDEDAKLAKACDANVSINKGFNAVFADIPEPEGPPSPEVAQKIKDGINKEVIPHIEEVEANAPEEIADEVKIAAKGVRDFRDDPANDPFEEEEVQEAVDEIDEYFYENCDLEKATVNAKEYEFSNIPENISTGDLSVQLENDGKEEHEFVVLTKKEGVTESFDDILNLPEEEGQKKVDFVGGAHASPGESGYAVFSFEKAGDYIAVCFIPQGTTGEEEEGEGGRASPAATGSPTAAGSPAGTASPTATGSPSPGGQEEGGPPHFTLGMKKEFKVA